jgi:hypothetical protein
MEDTRWIRGAFGLAPTARGRRTSSRPRTSAEFKFADTSLGGNQALNPPPQHTRFADPKVGGLLTRADLSEAYQSKLIKREDRVGSYSMGRFYSEVIDDNSQYVHMRFGVPKYTGMIAFFANMYDRDAARLAKTGKYSSAMRDLGRAAGLGAMFTLIPLGVLIPLIVTSQVLKMVTGKKPSKYYYLKPTPNLYLQAVQVMADTQLLHSKLVPYSEPFGMDRKQDVTESGNVLNSQIEELYESLPDIWKANGKFDVFRAVNRFQVLANYQAEEVERIYRQSKSEDEYLFKLQAYVDQVKRTNVMQSQVTEREMSLKALAMSYANNPMYQQNADEEREEAKTWDAVQAHAASQSGISGINIVNEQEEGQIADTATTSASSGVDPNQTNSSFWSGLWEWAVDGNEAAASTVARAGDMLASELKEGGDWITFRVDAKTTLSDSFSNSTREPEIASTMNSLSSAARSLEVNTSGGKTGFDIVDQAMSGVKDFVGGALEAFHITGLAAIYGSSIIDIPEVWDASTAQVGTESFTIQLRTPYGNDLAIFQNITLPLCFILAGCLPLATGKQTHTSPFLVELYSRGRQNIRLGIIDSVSIQRGTGNVGWRSDGKMLSCDVTFNVKDLSKVMHMPILKDPGMFDDDNMYTDYMATIGGASLQEMTSSVEKMIFNANKWKQSWKSAFMEGRITNSFANTFPINVLKAFSASSSR